MRHLPRLLALPILALLAAGAAHAQATRTWVSGVGDDANPCSRTAPCKTFAGAISKTAAGGEISVLDPGGYGAVTITKSITINGEGTLAGILSAGTSAVIVNAAAADEVVLKNLSIHGAETGIQGIRYLAGGQVTVENVTIQGVQGTAGTSRAVDVSLTTSGRLVMRNVSITNCEAGINAQTTAGTLDVVLDHVRIENTDGHGFQTIGAVRGVVSNSVFARNAFAGIRNQGGTSTIDVSRSVFYANNIGLATGVAGATIRISDSDIVENTTGISIAGGSTVASAGNNRVAGNGATTAPNATYTQQ